MTFSRILKFGVIAAAVMAALFCISYVLTGSWVPGTSDRMNGPDSGVGGERIN